MTTTSQAAPEFSRQRADVSIRLLGRFEVQVRGEPVLDASFSHSQASALVKLLALQESHALHREKVYDLLWPDFDQKAASNNLRQTLHRLRTGLAEGGLFSPLVENEGDMVALRPDLSFDVDEFRELADRARKFRTDPRLYERAVALYQGDLLPDDLYEDWTEPEREDLRELRNEVLLQFADLLSLHGKRERSEARLKELLKADPLHAKANLRLMEAYALSGRRSRAIRHYRAYAETLKQLDVQPGEEAAALAEQIQTDEFRPQQPPPVPVGVFVGREQEMEELRAGVDDALAGSGRIFMIGGEPGIGKTRATEELAVYASLRASMVLTGMCHEAEGVPPFWLWLQVVRAYARTCDTERLLRELGSGINEIARIVPELREQLHEPRQPSIDGEANSRFRVYDAVASFLKRASNTQPLAIILEDLHWAHSSSIELLRFLARDMRDSCLLVVGTYRAAELDDGHPLAGVLAELNREPHYRRLQLEGLSPEDIGRYISETAGVDLSSASVAAVHQKTEGNPFFAAQVVRLIASDEGLESDQDLTADELKIPQGVTEVISLRLDRLSEECRRILALASVIGRDFELALLESVSEISRKDLLQALGDAEAAGVVEISRDELFTYSFSHDLIKATLYESLGPAQRVSLHGRIGEELEQRLTSGSDVSLSELAHHFYNGALDGNPGKALEYCERAGDEAVDRFAYVEAAEQFDRACSTAQSSASSDPLESCGLLIKAGNAHSRAGNPVMATELLTKATAAAEQHGSAALQAAAALGLSVAFRRSTPSKQIVPVLDAALDASAGSDDSVRARLLASKSHAVRSNWDVALGLARDACQAADSSGDNRARLEALNAMQSMLLGSPRLEQRLATVQELVTVAGQLGDPQTMTDMLRLRASVFVEIGDLKQAELDWEEAEKVQPGTTTLYGETRAFPTMLALLRGNYQEAERMLSEYIPQAVQLRHERFRIATASQLFDLRRAQGRLDEMEEATLQAIRDAPEPGAPSPVSRLAFLYIETGRHELAADWYDRLSRNRYMGLGSQYIVFAVVGYSANVARRLGDGLRAGDLYDMVKGFGSRTISAGSLVYCGGSLSRSLGQLTAAMGRWSDSESHFEYALTYDERIEAWPWLARTRFEYASMLQERDAADDGQKAAALVDQALATFKALGMPKDREYALELKKLLKK